MQRSLRSVAAMPEIFSSIAAATYWSNPYDKRSKVLKPTLDINTLQVEPGTTWWALEYAIAKSAHNRSRFLYPLIFPSRNDRHKAPQ